MRESVVRYFGSTCERATLGPLSVAATQASAIYTSVPREGRVLVDLTDILRREAPWHVGYDRKEFRQRLEDCLAGNCRDHETLSRTSLLPAANRHFFRS